MSTGLPRPSLARSAIDIRDYVTVVSDIRDYVTVVSNIYAYMVQRTVDELNY